MRTNRHHVPDERMHSLDFTRPASVVAVPSCGASRTRCDGRPTSPGGSRRLRAGAGSRPGRPSSIRHAVVVQLWTFDELEFDRRTRRDPPWGAGIARLGISVELLQEFCDAFAIASGGLYHVGQIDILASISELPHVPAQAVLLGEGPGLGRGDDNRDRQRPPGC